MKEMGSRMRDMRASIDENEDERLKALMAGLRGSNINDSDFAGSGVRMNLVGTHDCWSLLNFEMHWKLFTLINVIQ
jgi:hypothetical protein